MVGAAVYAVVLVTRLGWILDLAHWAGDTVSVPLLSEHLARHISGTTYAPSDPFLNWMILDGLTAWIPGHRALWALAPVVLTLVIGVGILGLAINRLFGRRAAVLSMCVALCAPQVALATLVVQTVHAGTWFTDILLAALLCWVATAAAGRARLSVVAVVAGGFVGLAYVSDPLLLATGIAPFALAGLLALALHRLPGARRTAAFVAGLLAVTVASGVVTARLMRRAGIVVVNNIQPVITDGQGMVQNARWAWHNLNHLVNAPFGIGPAGKEPVALGLLHGALVVGALSMPFYLAWRIWRGRSTRAVNDRAGIELGRLLFLVFWLVSAGAVLLAFVVTNLATDTLTGRYLVPVLYAGAALVGAVAAAGTRRVAVVATLAVAVFCATGAAVLQAHSPWDADPTEWRVLAVLEQRGLTHGYGGYPMANPLTWKSEGRVEVRAVREACPGGGEASLCPFTFNTNSDWYRVQPGSPSFVLWNPKELWNPRPPGPEYGPPTEVLIVGDYRISVFPYDVAEHFYPGAP